MNALEPLLRELGISFDYARELLVLSLILLRTLPMIFLTPFLGGQVVPAVVKMGLGGLLALLVWPLARVSIEGEIPITVVPAFLLMLKEVFVGMAIGFINMEVFFIMEVAGRLIDTTRGTAMAEVMVPHSKGRATPFGNLYYQILIVFFMALHGHNIFIEAYAHSFEFIPLDRMFNVVVGGPDFFDFAMRVTNNLLTLATLLALPIAASTLITDIVFGLLNRVAPQLNAYFMSMPVKAMAGVILVFLIMEPFVDRATSYVVWGLQAAERTIYLLASPPLGG